MTRVMAFQEFVVTRDNVERLRRQEMRKQAAEMNAKNLGRNDDEYVGGESKINVRPSRRHSTTTTMKPADALLTNNKPDHSEADREQLKALRNIKSKHSSSRLQLKSSAETLGEAVAATVGNEQFPPHGVTTEVCDVEVPVLIAKKSAKKLPRRNSVV